MKFFHCLFTPFFIKKCSRSFFHCNKHAYCSFLVFPLYVATPSYLLPLPLIEYTTPTQKTQQKKKPNDTILLYKKKNNMFNKSSKSTKCFFMFSLKKIAASTMLLHVSIILYIKIYRKWISFSFFIPHFRCICNPLNLLCTFAYFSICTTAKKELIRHYVSLNFRIVIQYHLSDYYVLSKIKYKS